MSGPVYELKTYARHEADRASSHRTLIVDDDEDVRRAFEGILTQKGTRCPRFRIAADAFCVPVQTKGPGLRGPFVYRPNRSYFVLK